MHRDNFNLLKLCIYLLLLGCSSGILGCAPENHTDGESAPASLTYTEFVEGVAQPLVEMLKALSSFYHENAAPPQSLETLQRFAINNKPPMHLQGITGWQVSDLPQETDVAFQITTASTQSTPGQVTTSWKLIQSKSPPYNFTLVPLSPFCILHPPRTAGDVAFELVVNLTVAKAVHHSMGPLSDNKTCFRPPAADMKVRAQEEKTKEKLRNTMKQ